MLNQRGNVSDRFGNANIEFMLNLVNSFLSRAVKLYDLDKDGFILRDEILTHSRLD